MGTFQYEFLPHPGSRYTEGEELSTILEAYEKYSFNEEPGPDFETSLSFNNYIRYMSPDLITFDKCEKHLKKDLAFVTIRLSQSNLVQRKRDISTTLADKTGTIGEQFRKKIEHSRKLYNCNIIRRNHGLVHWDESH